MQNPINYRNRIKAAVIVGAGLPRDATQNYVGNLFDSQDATCPSLYLHVLNDKWNDIFLNDNTRAIPGLRGPANSALTNNYVNNSIKFHAYVDCHPLSEHAWGTSIGNTDFLNIITSPNASIFAAYNNPTIPITNTPIYQRMKHYTYFGLRLLSTGKIIGNFLTRATSTANPIASNVRFYVKPTLTRDLTGTSVAGYTTGLDYLTLIGNDNYPDGKLESIMKLSSCGPSTTCFVPDSVGCISIPNTKFGGGLYSPNAGRQANPNPTPTETKAVSLPVLYPNPTTGKININLQLENDINGYSVNIFSADGRSIYDNTINEQFVKGESFYKSYDISEQPNGVYFIRVTSENNILFNKTFVLNK